MEIPRLLLDDWAITPEALRALSDRALSDERTLALMARPGDPVAGTGSVEMRADYPGVAIIHVKGILVRYNGWWGAQSYGQILKDYQRCLDDPAVMAIAWNFDSPGGEVNGCAECADAIFAARGKKPMVAYASYACASGALWLASAVGDLRCASTAILGSIGIIAYLYDQAKMLQDLGVKQFEIVASQSPKKSQLPGDADYRSRVQQRLDDTCDVFVNAIARNYGVTAGYVLKNFGQGDVFVGARAVEAQLAKGLSNFEAVLSDLAARVQPQQTNFYNSGAQMDNKTMARLLKLDDSASERQIEDRAQQLAQLERSVLAATQSTDPDAAIGKIGAAMTAVVERDAARAELKAAEQAAVREEFKAALKDALKAEDGKAPLVLLGQLPMIAELCLSEEAAEKAIAAMAGVPEQKKKPLLAALCSVEVKPKALARLKSYLAMQQPQLPNAKKEPPDDKTNRDRVGAVSAADAAAAGLSVERAQQLAAIRNAGDLPVPKTNDGKGN